MPALVPVEKILRDLVVLGFGVFDLRYDAFGEQINSRVWVGQEDGRVGRDNQLGVVIQQTVQKGEHT